MIRRWDEIHGFDSAASFERFRRSIDDALESGELVETPVEDPYAGSELFHERWFTGEGGVVWRLVAPEPPFRGLFDRIR